MWEVDSRVYDSASRAAIFQDHNWPSCSAEMRKFHVADCKTFRIFEIFVV